MKTQVFALVVSALFVGSVSVENAQATERERSNLSLALEQAYQEKEIAQEAYEMNDVARESRQGSHRDHSEIYQAIHVDIDKARQEARHDLQKSRKSIRIEIGDELGSARKKDGVKHQAAPVKNPRNQASVIN